MVPAAPELLLCSQVDEPHLRTSPQPGKPCRRGSAFLILERSKEQHYQKLTYSEEQCLEPQDPSQPSPITLPGSEVSVAAVSSSHESWADEDESGSFKALIHFLLCPR